MSTIFGITEDKMKETSSTFTLTEIYQQPATWEKTCRQIEENKEELQKFIDQVIKCDDFDVILTGAGTSEFVGNALFAHLSGLLNHKAKSYRYCRYAGSIFVSHETDSSDQFRTFGKFTGVCRSGRCGRKRM